LNAQVPMQDYYICFLRALVSIFLFLNLK